MSIDDPDNHFIDIRGWKVDLFDPMSCTGGEPTKEYEDERKAWEEETLNVISMYATPKKYAEIESLIHNGRFRAKGLVKDLLARKLISEPPKMKQTERLILSNDEKALIARKRFEFICLKRDAVREVLEEMYGVVREDSSNKSASYYYYLENGMKVRLSSHINFGYEGYERIHVYLNYTDTMAEIVDKVSK